MKRGTVSAKDVGRRLRLALFRRAFVSESLRRCVAGGVLPESVWRRFPVVVDFVVHVGRDVHFQYVSSEYDAIGRRLYFGGVDAWEGVELRLFAEWARRSRTVIDVGAHTGVFSLAACAANPSVRVVAFEPLEAPRLQLRSALLLNGWESRCEVRIEAVSDERGTAHLYSGVHPFSSEASLLPQDGPCEVVPTLRLEDLEIDNVDLVKIDVERAEDRVLEGMRSWLERSPPALIFEMLADGPHAEVQRLLAPFGYVFFRLRAEGPVPVEGLVPAGGEPARNIAALPPDKRDWL